MPDLLINDCFLALSRLRNKIVEIESRRFPSHGHRIAVEFFTYLLDEFETALSRIQTEINKYKTLDHRESLQTMLSFLKSDFPSYLGKLESTTSEQVPTEIVRPLETLTHRVFPHVRLLFHPFNGHNYSFINVLRVISKKVRALNEEIDPESEFIKLLGTEAKPEGGRSAKPICLGFVSFPALEKNSCLQHSLTAHEIGHIIASERVHLLLRKKGDLKQQIKTRLRNSMHNISEKDQPRVVDSCMKLLRAYLNELYCDLAAFYLFGWATLLSMRDYSLGLDDLDDLSPSHPPYRLRIRYVLRYAGILEEAPCEERAGENSAPIGELPQPIQRILADLRSNANDEDTLQSLMRSNPYFRIVFDLLEEWTSDIEADVDMCFSSIRPRGDKLDIQTITHLIKRLQRKVTPNLVTEVFDSETDFVDQTDIRHILVAAWFHKVAFVDALEHLDYLEESAVADRLSLRAIEINYVHRHHKSFISYLEAKGYSRSKLGLVPPCERNRSGFQDGVLNSDEIIKRLRSQTENRIDVTPLLSHRQIADGAVDVRLGNEFIVIRKTAFPGLDVGQKGVISRQMGQYQERHKIDFGSQFVLHPNDLVLGSTLEYISLPEDVFAYVLSRSSWGRLGLLIATATAVNPGYKGCLTLELINLGEVPIVVYPGLPVAQLIFHPAQGGKYEGRYTCPTGPGFSAVHQDIVENAFWSSPYEPSL